MNTVTEVTLSKSLIEEYPGSDYNEEGDNNKWLFTVALDLIPTISVVLLRSGSYNVLSYLWAHARILERVIYSRAAQFQTIILLGLAITSLVVKNKKQPELLH